MQTGRVSAVSEYLTEDPFNDGIEVRRHEAGPSYTITIPAKSRKSCRILGRYRTRTDEDRGVATVLYTRKDGTRAAILGCGGFETAHVSSSRVRFLYRVVDAVSDGKLPALPCEPVQCCIVPRILADGTLRSVTVLNTVIMKQRPFELQLRGVPDGIRTVKWCVPGEDPVPLKLKRTGGKCTAQIPEIAAWDIGWLKIGR